MTPIAQNMTQILAVGVVVLDILVLLAALGLIFFRDVAFVEKILRYISKHGVLIGFLLTLGALAGSLYYSDIIGFAPCDLCWWQRVFLYPQVVLFGIALYRKHKGSYHAYVFAESLVLSLIGGAIALFNYYGQSFNPAALAACGASAVSCSKLYFNIFGFVTIPLMSLTVFAALILLVLIRRKF